MQTVTATLWRGDLHYAGEVHYIDRDVATVRLTPGKKVADGNGYDEGGTYLQYTRVPRNCDQGS